MLPLQVRQKSKCTRIHEHIRIAAVVDAVEVDRRIVGAVDFEVAGQRVVDPEVADWIRMVALVPDTDLLAVAGVVESTVAAVPGNLRTLATGTHHSEVAAGSLAAGRWDKAGLSRQEVVDQRRRRPVVKLEACAGGQV